MKIINLGNSIYTNYLIQTENGCILIDAGNNTSYEVFLKRLAKNHIDKSEIKHLILTHVHADHISYLEDILKDVHPVLYVGEGARENLLRGEDNHVFYSSHFSKLLTKLTLKAKGGPAKWKPFDIADYSQINVSKATYIQGFDAVVIPLKGHTNDSIGLLKKEGAFFVGDAVMATFPAIGLVPLLIENVEAFKASYNELINCGAPVFYPGHGRPFVKTRLLDCKAGAMKIKAR